MNDAAATLSTPPVDTPAPPPAQDLTLANGGKPVVVFKADGNVEFGAGVKPSDAATQLLAALKLAYADPHARQVAQDSRNELHSVGTDVATLGRAVESATAKLVGVAAGVAGLNLALLAVVLVKVWKVRTTQLALVARSFGAQTNAKVPPGGYIAAAAATQAAPDVSAPS